MEEIALKSGFTSLSIFSRNFKAELGQPPSEFRNKHNKKKTNNLFKLPFSKECIIFINQQKKSILGLPNF